VLNQLKRRSKLSTRSTAPGRRNLYIIAGDFGNVAAGGTCPKRSAIRANASFGMKKPARNWID